MMERDITVITLEVKQNQFQFIHLHSSVGSGSAGFTTASLTKQLMFGNLRCRQEEAENNGGWESLRGTLWEIEEKIIPE